MFVIEQFFLSFLKSQDIYSYDDDVWTEIAKYLDGKSIARLGMTNRWFRKLANEESVWKYACLRDLQVPAFHAVHSSWMKVYISAFGKKEKQSIHLRLIRDCVHL